MGAGSCCLPFPSKAGKMRGKFKKIGKNKGDSQMVPPVFIAAVFIVFSESHGRLQILRSFLSSCSFARCFRLWILSDHFSRRTRIAS